MRDSLDSSAKVFLWIADLIFSGLALACFDSEQVGFLLVHAKE
jgi:hypothetical protein